MKRPIGVNAAGEVMFIEEVKTMADAVMHAANTEARLVMVVRKALLEFLGQEVGVVASLSVDGTRLGWINEVDVRLPTEFHHDGGIVSAPASAKVMVALDGDMDITKMAEAVVDALITSEMKGPN